MSELAPVCSQRVLYKSSSNTSKSSHQLPGYEEGDIGTCVLAEVHISLNNDNKGKDEDKDEVHSIKREDSCENLIVHNAAKVV